MVWWRLVFRLSFICGFSLPALALRANDAALQPRPDVFAKTVGPLLIAKCVGCHSGSDSKAGLDLTRQEKLLAGG